MRNNHSVEITDKNLDRLADFLTLQLKDSNLAEQIPNVAHIFHGSYKDATLTQANVKLATKTVLGMALGYIEQAPLVMIFEYQPGKQTVIDLSADLPINETQTFIETLQRNVVGRINAILTTR